MCLWLLSEAIKCDQIGEIKKHNLDYEHFGMASNSFTDLRRKNIKK